MTKFLRIALIFGFALATAAQAQTRVRSLEGVDEYQLPNGLQVLLAPNLLQPRTYVNLVVKAGSAVEGLGEGGMAHLLEHMVFKGTPTTKDPMREFNERALSYNGTTNRDRTNYFASMNPDADKLHWYLGWLADAMSNSVIAKADLDTEMTVVRNEFERAGNSAIRGLHEARMALTFQNHGYGRSTLGTLSDLENVPIDKLQAFYKTWYRPDNMVLVVTGRFDAAATLAHINTVFGATPKPTVPLPSLYTREPVQQGVRGATLNRVGGEVQTLISWRGAPMAHRDDAVLDVVAHALSNPAIGRFSTAVNQQQLGSAVNVSHTSMKEYGLFEMNMQVSSATQVNSAQTVLLQQVDAIAQRGVTEEELARAKTFYQTRSTAQKSTAESFGSALAEAAASGDWRLGFWHRDQMASVTVADTQRAASEYLVEANRVRVSYIPQPEPKRAPDVSPIALGDYTPALQPSASSTFAPLEPFEAVARELDARTVRSVLPVGTRMALIARPAVGDAIQGTLRLHWGNADSLRGQWAASLMGSLLLRGGAVSSRQQIEDTLNMLNSSLSIQSNVYGLTVSFKTTREHWPAFATLLHSVLRQTEFKPAVFDTWKRQIIANWQAGRDAPETLAQTTINRALYGYGADDVRYQPSNEEAIAMMQALTVEDVQAFWARFAGASVSEFAAVGALDAAAMQASMANVLNGWDTPGGAAAVQRIDNPLPNYSPMRHMIQANDKPNAVYRSTALFAQDPQTREGAALQLANSIIGVSSLSRIYTRLRKQEGLTYGTSSNLTSNEDDKVMGFHIQGSFAPNNRERFETALAQVFGEIAKEGLLESELATAKRIQADNNRAARDNNASVASILANNEYRARLGEQRDFVTGDARSAVIQSITLAELNAAAKRLADASTSVMVLVGDFAK